MGDGWEGNIRLDRDLGGGCLGDLGYYCVRVAIWAFGGKVSCNE